MCRVGQNAWDLMKLLDHRPQDLVRWAKTASELSRGVLIDESPILLFDEPLANLDPGSRVRILI